MRLIALSPPIIIASLVLLGASAAKHLLDGTWYDPTIADAAAFLGLSWNQPGVWASYSPGWLLLVLGLILGEVGLIQSRLLAVREQKMMSSLKMQAEERRAIERHADMIQRRGRRLNRILNKAA